MRADIGGDVVECAELVLIPPSTPVVKALAVPVELFGCRRRAVSETHLGLLLEFSEAER